MDPSIATAVGRTGTGPCPMPRLRDYALRIRIANVRRVLAIFLAWVVIVQLIPSCGSWMAAEAAQTACCRTKCPMQSPAERSGCCQRMVSTSNAVAPTTASRPIVLFPTALVSIASYVRNAQGTLIAYRSPAPPPRNSRAALCSLQI